MRELLLNAAALKNNLQQVKFKAPRSNILAMVKANAYGHGLVWAAKHLVIAGANALGVADIEEALQLRKEGIQAPILLLDGIQTKAMLDVAIIQRLHLVVHDFQQIELLESLRTNQKIHLWLKVDSGLHRMGFLPEDVETAYQRLIALNCAHQPIVLMTHFSDADVQHSVKTKLQIELFQNIHRQLTEKFNKPIQTSLANSAGILAWPDSHGDWVRPGIMLYGASPFSSQTATELQLQPVMTIKSCLIAIHDYPAGECIGYGGTYTCRQKTRAGVVAFGYGDGYPRAAHGSHVLIQDQLFPVIGRISMDLLQIDLTDHPEIQLGEMATLFGENLPVEKLATAANTIAYEILCRIMRHRTGVKYQ
ncbi:MAG: alr [Gammaproteobacteria bacterium]|nr:alr [Gammaproteobacteria bacterium]